MFRHIVLLKYKPEATEAERLAVREAVEKLPSRVPEIVSGRSGVNVGNGPNHYDVAIVFDFEDCDAFKRYIASTPHQAYVQGPAKAVGQLAVLQHTW